MSMTEAELPMIEGYVGETTPEPDRPRRGRPPGSKNRATKNDRDLQDEIATKLIEASAPLAIMSPLAGAVINERAERTAKALVILAGKNAKFREALDKIIKVGIYWDLAILPLAIGVAFMVDFGRMPPDAFMSERLNVKKHYDEIYPPEDKPDIDSTGHSVSSSGLYSV